MDAESYRNNWQNLSGKLRAQYSDLSEEDLERASTSETNLMDVMNERYGIGHEELKQHFEEFMEHSGDTASPTVDPPVKSDPEENTAPPQ